MSSLSIHGLSKSFGSTRVLGDVSFDIQSGEFFSLLGPSGCGKSTLLRIIAGLEDADRGTVSIDGKRIDHVAPQERGIGMVFQQYALWPHMTIGQNVSFGLESLSLSKAECESRMIGALTKVQMESLVDRFPHQVSGGQQQRVALARALAMQPSIILLDEPLSNLDARLRAEIRQELVELHHSLGTTMIYVTHDQEDALALSSRIAIIHQGAIQQIGTPREIYSRPTSPFVAKFIGDANLIPCVVAEQTASMLKVRLKTAEDMLLEAPLPSTRTALADAKGYLCVRPSNLSLSTDLSKRDAPHLQASVRRVTYRGSSYLVELTASGAAQLHAELRECQLPPGLKDGDQVVATWGVTESVFISSAN